MNGTRHYDAAIIGAGQDGKPLAIAMAAAGTARRAKAPG
jgi:cation diffusion facilitator CzcD-associated flavoprotein CzcO